MTSSTSKFKYFCYFLSLSLKVAEELAVIKVRAGVNRIKEGMRKILCYPSSLAPVLVQKKLRKLYHAPACEALFRWFIRSTLAESASDSDAGSSTSRSRGFCV